MSKRSTAGSVGFDDLWIVENGGMYRASHNDPRAARALPWEALMNKIRAEATGPRLVEILRQIIAETTDRATAALAGQALADLEPKRQAEKALCS
jgi:hypothetical protein